MNLKATARALILAAILSVAQLTAVWAERSVELGPPPKFSELTAPIPATTGTIRVYVPPINIKNRAEVVTFFNAVYKASEGVAAQWSGNIATCSPGTTSIAYRDATLLRVNFFRVMAGLPGNVVFNPTWDSQCQQAALIMIAEGNLNHTPPTSWACYTTDGAAAAEKSNLALGSDGPQAIDLYMDDFGSFNTAVGHRRWILYPPQQTMGSGSTTGQTGYYHGSNALWVIGGSGTRSSTPEWVAWPPPGFVPYQLVYDRWSFSRQSAGFTNATITMTHKGNPISIAKEPVANGYGDNTVVWVPAGMPTSAPSEDLTYTVTIGNVLVGGTPRQFVYDVTIIDPDAVVETGVQGAKWKSYR